MVNALFTFKAEQQTFCPWSRTASNLQNLSRYFMFIKTEAANTSSYTHYSLHKTYIYLSYILQRVAPPTVPISVIAQTETGRDLEPRVVEMSPKPLRTLVYPNSTK